MRILLALVMLLAPVPALSQPPGALPLVRTSLNPSDGVVIGQPVTVSVAVLFPGEMQHPPLVRLPEAAGAQIMRFESQGTTIRDTVDGCDYLGQSFEFVLFPRRGGTIEIPPPAITLLDRAGDPVGTTTGTATRLEVTVPPGIDPSSPVLVTENVVVDQSWSPPPDKARFKAGDAVVRTIQRRAAGVPALGMAEFRFTAPDGVRVYVDPPAVEDRSTRLGVDGHRTDRVTYVFEKPGTYALPALTQPWLTLSSKAIREEPLPGTNVVVATASTGQDTHGSIPWITAMAILGAALFAVLALPSGLRRWRAARARWLSSPEFHRRDCAQVAEKGDARATYAAYMRWRSTLSPAQLEVLVANDALALPLARLERTLFGRDEGEWRHEDGHALARAVHAVQPAGHRGRATKNLPGLNPARHTGA